MTLVPVAQLNYPAEESSALMCAVRGELVADDLDLDLGTDHNDMEGILPDLPMLKVDGGAGVFLEREQDPRTAPAEMVGLILARQGSKVFFPPRERLLDYARSVGFRELLSDELKWICRAANIGRPKEAELNPALTPAQLDEAKRLRIGGATGAGCVGCPAAVWHDPGDGSAKLRLCKDGENLIWLDSQREEPVVLSIIASSSVVSLTKYLKTCFSKGRPLPLFRHLVRLSFVKEKSDKPGVKDYFVFQIANLQQLDRATLQSVAPAYHANLYMLDRAGSRIESVEGSGFEPSAEVNDSAVDPGDPLDLL